MLLVLQQMKLDFLLSNQRKNGASKAKIIMQWYLSGRQGGR